MKITKLLDRKQFSNEINFVSIIHLNSPASDNNLGYSSAGAQERERGK
jgi:hypothetical protein